MLISIDIYLNKMNPPSKPIILNDFMREHILNIIVQAIFSDILSILSTCNIFKDFVT